MIAMIFDFLTYFQHAEIPYSRVLRPSRLSGIIHRTLRLFRKKLQILYD